MPLADRNIIITPNRGASSEPQIRFTGADTATSATITLKMYNSSTVGQLSIEGNAGQLFSVVDSLVGSIFSVNDVSGIPSLEVFDTGEIRMNQFGGFVDILSTTQSTTTATGALQVVGGVGIGGNLALGGAIYEKVFTITDGAAVDINPANGTIQLWTLGASRTPTASSFTAGQSVTLMILDGASYTITWSTISVTWVGGSAPGLDATKYTVIELWKVSTTVYGALVGYA